MSSHLSTPEHRSESRWAGDDYLVSVAAIREPDDFWTRASPNPPWPPASEVAALATTGIDPALLPVTPCVAPIMPFDDEWFEAPASIAPVASFADILDLPRFDADATVARPVADLFSKPFVRPSDVQATILANETGIITPSARDAAARLFASGLQDTRWPKFFDSWMRLAPALDCPLVLRQTLELREYWEDSPHLWLRRRTPGWPGAYHPAARNEMSWPRALAIAANCPHAAVEELLGDDVLTEWIELDEVGDGFWSFAEFVALRALADEAMDAAIVTAVLHAREKRAVQRQEGLDRFTPAALHRGLMFDGYLETGTAMRASIADLAPTEEEA